MMTEDEDVKFQKFEDEFKKFDKKRLWNKKLNQISYELTEQYLYTNNYTGIEDQELERIAKTKIWTLDLIKEWDRIVKLGVKCGIFRKLDEDEIKYTLYKMKERNCVSKKNVRFMHGNPRAFQRLQETVHNPPVREVFGKERVENLKNNTAKRKKTIETEIC